MGGLGSIFEDAAPESDAGPRGEDLRYAVEVPRAALGREAGYAAQIPRELPGREGLVSRVVSPFERGERVTLRLPASFPDGATLKLRGQGAAGPGGAGDLLLTIRLVDRGPASRAGSDPRRAAWIGLGLALVLGSALGAWILFAA